MVHVWRGRSIRHHVPTHVARLRRRTHEVVVVARVAMARVGMVLTMHWRSERIHVRVTVRLVVVWYDLMGRVMAEV